VNSMKIKPQKILTSWIAVVFIAYVALAAFQKFAIYPIEALLLPVYAQYASLMYLPHAVRVLATVIYGPKTFFVLLPAVLFEAYLLYPKTDGLFSITTIAIAVIGAACAPIAFLLLNKIGGVDVSGSDARNLRCNWRCVFAGGLIASAINSIGLTAFFFDLSDINTASLAMARFFVGDIIGLLVGLVVLTFIFRLLRHIKAT